MAERMPFFHDLPEHSYKVVLDGVQFFIRLTWRDRTASWYMDMADQDGVYLLRGIRLSPGSSPNRGLTVDGPDGAIVPFGKDPYDRFELELLYMTAAEIAEVLAEAAAAELQVVLD